jgi:pheromone shutdown protein TraB
MKKWKPDLITVEANFSGIERASQISNVLPIKSGSDVFYYIRYANTHGIPVIGIDSDYTKADLKLSRAEKALFTIDRLKPSTWRKLIFGPDNEVRELALRYPSIKGHFLLYRESVMAKHLEYLTGTYKRIAFPVGGMHVDGLMERLRCN